MFEVNFWNKNILGRNIEKKKWTTHAEPEGPGNAGAERRRKQLRHRHVDRQIFEDVAAAWDEEETSSKTEKKALGSGNQILFW